MSDERTVKVVSTTRNQPAAPRATRTRLAPLVKLTRAHVGLQERPALATTAAQVLASVAADLGKQLAVPVTFDGRLLDATLHPFTHLTRNAVYVVVELCGNGRAAIELDAPSVSAILQHAAGSVDDGGFASTKLTRIEEAALGSLLLSALASVRAHSLFQERFAPRLVGFPTERAPVLEQLDSRQRHLAVELTMRVGEQVGLVRLLVPALVLQGALESIPRPEAIAAAPEVLAAALEARCFVGAAVLRGDEAQSLTAGDVVVFHGLTGSNEFVHGSGRVQTRSFTLLGDFGADGFTLTRAAPRTLPQELAMNDNDPTLPVELEIELTRIRIPLSQLGTLKAGAVLALHVNGAQPVTLRIGDKAIAKAELVDIEGEIGARILSLL